MLYILFPHKISQLNKHNTNVIPCPERERNINENPDLKFQKLMFDNKFPE